MITAPMRMSPTFIAESLKLEASSELQAMTQRSPVSK
jgi:hypothetical protein